MKPHLSPSVHHTVAKFRQLITPSPAGSIVPKLEAAVGPRTPAGGAGGQQGFVQRKTALSKLARPRFDGMSHRGPGRY